MKYAGIIKNDVSAGSGVCVSFFVQGCPHHCPGCHNPNSWDFDGGKELTADIVSDMLDSIEANGVRRNFCILGGEPLCPENIPLTLWVLQLVRERYPDIKTYVWTGYPWDAITQTESENLDKIKQMTDYLITEPFELSKRDITLPMRGSSNQKVINLRTNKEVECIDQII